MKGATLVAGGPNRPEGLNKGYFIRPTIFTDVSNNMRIAKEEIFGPVLSIIPFDTEEEAIAITNDTSYGLGNYVQTQDKEKAKTCCEDNLDQVECILMVKVLIQGRLLVVIDNQAMVAKVVLGEWRNTWK